MVFYLLGLSGVGKTRLAQAAAAAHSHISYIELDRLMRQTDSTLFHHPGTRWPEFWRLAKAEIARLEEGYAGEQQIYLCDVGAGCMQVWEAFDYFSLKAKVILVWDKPESIFDRVRRRPTGPWRYKSFPEFRAAECTEAWTKLRCAVSYLFDVAGRSEREAVQAFINFAGNLEE